MLSWHRLRVPRQSKRSLEQQTAILAFRVATGERLRCSREAAGVTQKEFAAALGLNSSIISKTEKGDQPPSALLVREYSRAFGVTADFLLFGVASAPDPGETDHAATAAGWLHALPRRRLGPRPP